MGRALPEQDSLGHQLDLGADAGGGDATSAITDSDAATGDDSTERGLTPRPTSTPHKKMTTDKTVAAMNRNTSCLPFSCIS